MQVNAETLQKHIKRLQALGNAEYALPLTINEEYQLEAYKMLLGFLRQQCQHEWFKGKGAGRCCADCGERMPKYD